MNSGALAALAALAAYALALASGHMYSRVVRGKLIWYCLALGAGFLFVTLVVQPPIQSIPFRLLGLEAPALLKDVSTIAFAATALWLALVSGLVQEGLKLSGMFIFKGGDSISVGASIGLGFGLAEASLLGLGLLSASILGIKEAFAPFNLLMGVSERLTAALFHIASATLLAYGYSRGRAMGYYLAMALVHTALNASAVYASVMRGSLAYFEAIWLIAMMLFAVYSRRVILRSLT